MESRDLLRIALIAAGVYIAAKIIKGGKDLAWSVFGIGWVVYWTQGVFPIF